MAANGTSIRTYGRRTLKISFAPNHTVQQQFWIADVRRPLLGADFFLLHSLVIDIPGRRLSSSVVPNLHYLSLIHI